MNTTTVPATTQFPGTVPDWGTTTERLALEHLEEVVWTHTSTPVTSASGALSVYLEQVDEQNPDGTITPGTVEVAVSYGGLIIDLPLREAGQLRDLILRAALRDDGVFCEIARPMPASRPNEDKALRRNQLVTAELHDLEN